METWWASLAPGPDWVKAVGEENGKASLFLFVLSSWAGVQNTLIPPFKT